MLLIFLIVVYFYVEDGDDIIQPFYSKYGLISYILAFSTRTIYSDTYVSVYRDDITRMVYNNDTNSISYNMVLYWILLVKTTNNIQYNTMLLTLIIIVLL